MALRGLFHPHRHDGHRPQQTTTAPLPESAYTTVVLRGLPLGTDSEDIKRHFISHLRSPVPTVGSIVPDSQSRHSIATVTFFAASSTACDDAIQRLNTTRFHSRYSDETTDLRVDNTFHGLTPLAQHNEPMIDLYFVHGLGGHAFKTWAADCIDYQRNGSLCMWPRDFLPEAFRLANIPARFSTLGYSANVVRDSSPNDTILSMAEDLLNRISFDRPPGSTRPIYFICHSLGGLVVCQALVLALAPQGLGIRVREQDRALLAGIVRGIAFFGTPFYGSGHANYLEPFVKTLATFYPSPVNAPLINALREKNAEIAELVNTFNRIRVRDNIHLRIFFESEPVIGTRLVTNRESAVAAFDDNVRPQKINKSHVNMTKFWNRSEPDYDIVEHMLIQMVQNSLSGPPHALPAQLPQRPVDDSPDRQATAHPALPLRQRFSPHDTPTTDSPRSSGMLQQFPFSASDHSVPMAGRDPDARTSPEGFNTSAFQGHGRNYSVPQQLSQAFQAGVPPGAAEADSRAINAPTPPTSSGGYAAPVQSNLDNNSVFAKLKAYDTAFVIDDSGSMQLRDEEHGWTRWEHLKEAMRHVGEIAAQYDPNGVDVYFLLRQDRDLHDATDPAGIMAVLDGVDPTENGGGTVVGGILADLLNDYIRRYRDYRKLSVAQKRDAPLRYFNLIVITDGKADDPDEVTEAIVNAAKDLDEFRAPRAPSSLIGVQFVQVGRDMEAAEWLRSLDDDLGDDVRDMVDTTPFDKREYQGLSFQEKLEKILMGSISRQIDKRGNVLTDAVPELPGHE